MKHLIWILAFVGASSLSSANVLTSFLHHDLEVYANGDVMVAGKNVPRPDAEHPLYYLAVAAGYQDFGKAIAGEKPPTQKAMIDVLTKVLSKQGYKLATNKNPPQIVIVYSWGTLNSSVLTNWSSGGGITSSPPPLYLNGGQILNFIGYNKSNALAGFDRTFPEYSPGLILLRDDASSLLELGKFDYHAIAIAAYDYEGFKEGKAVTLWRTRIASPSLGFDMFDALPKIAAIAAPQIGRQTDKPVHILASDHYRPDVDIGPATVVRETN